MRTNFKRLQHTQLTAYSATADTQGKGKFQKDAALNLGADQSVFDYAVAIVRCDRLFARSLPEVAAKIVIAFSIQYLYI